MKKHILLLIICLFTFTKVAAASEEVTSYVLAAQWVPGWCAAGTGASGAVLNPAVCKHPKATSVMYHGLWPNFLQHHRDYCASVPPLDKTRLNFANPYAGYLLNATSFIDHEWQKHGTCSTFFPTNTNVHSGQYYQAVNHYFMTGIHLYEAIHFPRLTKPMPTSLVRSLIHQANPSIPSQSIILGCEKDATGQEHLTNIWFCMNKNADQYIPCAAPNGLASC